MDITKTLELIKTRVESEVADGNDTASNVRLQNGELLWAALALLGYAYSQERGLKEGEEAEQFWPFGKFAPSETVKENLIRSCQMIIFEIDRLNVNEVDNSQG